MPALASAAAAAARRALGRVGLGLRLRVGLGFRLRAGAGVRRRLRFRRSKAAAVRRACTLPTLYLEPALYLHSNPTPNLLSPAL